MVVVKFAQNQWFIIIILVLSGFSLSAQNSLPYDLENPSETYLMPDELEEISGIHLTPEGHFACIQDEDGIIFIYDTAQRKVIEEIEFGPDKDYEDIELIGEDAYVLESDGDIRWVKDYRHTNRETIRFDTEMSSDNDAEGLTYHEASHSLLIACKGKASLSDDLDMEGYRAVYRFDLNNHELLTAPVMLIKLDDLMDYSNLNPFAKISYKLAAMLDSNGDIRFQPSAISIHPDSEEIYILSFTSTMLAVYDAHGSLKTAKDLNKRIFLQPEGLCFDQKGTLYISNEGNGGTANVLKFPLIKN
ncbi:MAG: SdiA-regulated domain-containing protein [Bacteroidota bacterium]